MADYMKCKCGGRLYRVLGLSTENEGIRDDAWCEQCYTMFTVSKGAVVRRLVLQDRYKDGAADRLRNHAQAILDELEHEVQTRAQRHALAVQAAQQKANRKLARIIKKGTPG